MGGWLLVVGLLLVRGGFLGIGGCRWFGWCLGLLLRFLFFCFGGDLVGLGRRLIRRGRCIFRCVVLLC